MKSKKLILSLSVIFTFLFCVLISITAFTIIEQIKYKNEPETHAADHITGSGTSSDPYLVYTVTGYKTLLKDYSRDNYNKIYVKLMNNLIITIASKSDLPNWNENANATFNDIFIGGVEFDGNYKYIQFGCTINLDGNGNIGSIAPIPYTIGSATIRNLKTFGHIDVSGKSEFPPVVGGLIGCATGIDATGLYQPNITIDNCYVDVDINSRGSDIGSSAALIGYTCNSSGGLYGSINVKNTMCSGSVSGNFWSVGTITGSTGYSGNQVSISSTNTCFTGSVKGCSSDSDPGVPFSYAYNDGTKFVKGDWGNQYSSYRYSSSPSLSWLQNATGVGINPYKATYKAVTTGGTTIISGDAGYLIEALLWSYSDGVITTQNFGVQDRSINISSAVKNYTYKEKDTNVNNTAKTVEFILTFQSPTLKISFECPTGARKSSGNITFGTEYEVYSGTASNFDYNYELYDRGLWYLKSVSYSFTDVNGTYYSITYVPSSETEYISIPSKFMITNIDNNIEGITVNVFEKEYDTQFS